MAFLGFMSVAGIPAFLEERQVFMRERMNGLYGPGAYVLANSVVTLPYLFVCVVLFAVISYWSIGLNPGADQFFRFVGVLFLAVYTAESQASISPFSGGSQARVCSPSLAVSRGGGGPPDLCCFARDRVVPQRLLDGTHPFRSGLRTGVLTVRG